MAINFPNNPSEGDVWSEAGTTWQYRFASWTVLSGDAGDPVTIVEAETSTNTGFTIWGDTLIQWGVNTTTTAGMLAVTLPQAYDAATDYQVVAQYDRGDIPGSALWSVYAKADSGSQISLGLHTSNNLTPQEGGVAWITMGAAPVALRQPKTVQTVGGSELQEFHDPTWAGSWRIVGNTLECWGHSQTSAGLITYPKTFARTPSIMASALHPTDNVTVSIESESETGFTGRGYLNGTQQSVGMRWHAIGQWDGS